MTNSENWYWRECGSGAEHWYDFMDAETGQMLAFIKERPSYCDRGHWSGHIEVSCGLDAADCWPNYYMNLDRAKAEIREFLNWRLNKVRAE